MRMIFCGGAVLALTACAPAIPESGVGFTDYDSYQQASAARDAQLSRQSIPGPNVVSSETLAPVTGRPTSGAPKPDAADVAAETQAALAATRANSGRAPLDASPSNPAPAQLNNPGISDENNFEAVGSRRTIQSDAARIAQNRAQYQVIAPTALPTRTANSGPNLAEYALKSTNALGQSAYRRVNFNAQAKYQRNCAKYASPDLAQSDFLASGGPKKDRHGLDPDGDGFACTWDPTPFRKARNG